jgi:glutathione peroxidase-family protein
MREPAMTNQSIRDAPIHALQGALPKLADYKGKALLPVNGVSERGLTRAWSCGTLSSPASAA